MWSFDFSIETAFPKGLAAKSTYEVLCSIFGTSIVGRFWTQYTDPTFWPELREVDCTLRFYTSLRHKCNRQNTKNLVYFSKYQYKSVLDPSYKKLSDLRLYFDWKFILLEVQLSYLSYFWGVNWNNRLK